MHHLSFSLAVPEPAVAVLSTQDDKLLSGTYLRINCSIDLNPAVDTQVAVTNLWQRNEVDISDNSRVMVSQPSEMESHYYEAYIEFSTLSSAVDGGTYICTVTAAPSTMQEYIISGIGAASYTITVVGKHMDIEVCMISVQLLLSHSPLRPGHFCGSYSSCTHWPRY